MWARVKFGADKRLGPRRLPLARYARAMNVRSCIKLHGPPSGSPSYTPLVLLPPRALPSRPPASEGYTGCLPIVSDITGPTVFESRLDPIAANRLLFAGHNLPSACSPH
jgi:hypothetical protein